MKVVVIGGSGILGSYLAETLPEQHRLVLTYRCNRPEASADIGLVELDLRDNQATEVAFERLQPDLVINAAGLNDVDQCERDPEAAYAHNVLGTICAMRESHRVGARYVHISSNAVYGEAGTPHDESSPRTPSNVYGITKMNAEDLVLGDERTLLVRLSPLYGWNRAWSRRNPLPWMVDTLADGGTLRLATDLTETPLAVECAARGIWTLIEKQVRGAVNLGGAQAVNRYELGLAVAQAFALPPEAIETAKADDFDGLAPRARDTSFNSRRFVSLTGRPLTTLADGLARATVGRTAGSQPLIAGRIRDGH